jgi:hypothetical protein
MSGHSFRWNMSYLVTCPRCGCIRQISYSTYKKSSQRHSFCRKCGVATAKRKKEIERYWEKVEINNPNDCWLWIAGKNELGYGIFNPKAHVRYKAHKYLYELLHGIVPQGYELDHLCRVHNCVNPTHLEVVTHKENIRRAIGLNDIGIVNRMKTHCPREHLYNTENTYISPKGKRICRLCRKISQNKAVYLKRERILTQNLG